MVLATDPKTLARVRDAALSAAPISLGVRRTASPHEFYRYPARFSPDLAAAAIDAFTSPGDLVADYFVGGGTTLVEARRASRLGVGSDINSLSVFVSTVKTRLYSEADLAAVARWAGEFEHATATAVESGLSEDAFDHYFRNVGEDVDAQRGLLVQAVAALNDVESRKARDLARCVLLRTAQWGLDMRREVPSAPEFRVALADNAARMIDVARTSTREYRTADKGAVSAGLSRSLVVEQGLPGVADHPELAEHPAPRLVLTSPPYPGVYVNYHRWKVRGRRETPFPYYLAGQQDGNGLAYYTMGARSDRTQNIYFRRLREAFQDIAQVCDDRTCIVQVVGFNDVADQLARYLETMTDVGLAEVKFQALATDADGRLWRSVPGRRWWAKAGDRSAMVSHTAREVVLIHKLA